MIVNLTSDQTCVTMTKPQRKLAIDAAFWSTASPHEHVWTQEQQFAMAHYCLWATQRLSAIEQIVDGKLIHP